MRLFVGVKLDQDIQKKIYSNFKTLPSCYRLTKIENIHITLFFLGEVDEVFIPEIINKIKFAINNKPKIKVTLNSIGQFPEKEKARIIYITGEQGEKELKKLSELIKENLNEFKENKNKEEEFKFHITVARFNEREKFIPYKLPEIKEDITFEIEEICLLKSDLKPEGPVYTELWHGSLL